MRVRNHILIVNIINLIIYLSNLNAGIKPSVSVSIPGIVTVTATEKSAPPGWAVMERHLIKIMNEAAPEFLNKYADSNGWMPLIGKPDDMYEVFGNWPLFYVLGGDEKVYELGMRQWNAITRELSSAVKRVDREFVIHYDWFHHAESYKNYYYFGLADPLSPENIIRARRFAEIYTGEDSIAHNYDPVYKIMRSPITGSTGPLFEQDGVYLINHGHMSLSPFMEDPEPGWENDPEKHDRIQKLYNDIVLKGDTPVSLSAAALVANAYLYTGDEKYKRWIIEYVEAWMKRIGENNGIIPDNIGLTGKIGEYRNGQWWGGHFGWSARYSLHMMFGALTTASEVAYLITSDPKYLNLLRSQLDIVSNNSKTVDGQLLFPYKYGPNGWFDYRPLEVRELSHLWNVSRNLNDWQRIEELLAGSKYAPRPYDNYNDYAMPVTGHRTYKWISNGKRMDFAQVISNGDIGDKMQEQEELNEAPRLLYLSGKNPDFPEKILEANYREVLRRIELSRSIKDIYKVPDIHSEYLAGINPVVTHGLVYLTMGGPAAIYNGGLLQVRVRYFDMHKLRPGLPEDVAALVEKLEDDFTILNLVNLSPFETHSLIIQAGAYGEHEFTGIRYKEQSKDKNGTILLNERSVPVNKKYFAVEIPPATSIQLKIGARRFVNKPSYAFPWY